MTIVSRWAIWIVVAIAVLTGGVLLIMFRISSGISASVEHKAAKVTSATVISASAIQKAGSSVVTNKPNLYSVCFKIDNFDQVPSDIREQYLLAENRRLTLNGPRCKVTSKTELAKNISQGEKLSIVYLLENQYQIDVVAVSAFGEDL